jgi:hypothetical protein
MTCFKEQIFPANHNENRRDRPGKRIDQHEGWFVGRMRKKQYC